MNELKCYLTQLGLAEKMVPTEGVPSSENEFHKSCSSLAVMDQNMTDLLKIGQEKTEILEKIKNSKQMIGILKMTLEKQSDSTDVQKQLAKAESNKSRLLSKQQTTPDILLLSVMERLEKIKNSDHYSHD